MLGLAVLALGLAAGTPSLATVLHPQDQLQSVFQQSQGSEYFQFAHKIKRVAVIGAGVSGLVGTAVLQDHNLTVRTFERAPKPGSTVSHHFRPFSLPFETLGGNWYFSEETPIAANYDPALRPSEADYKPALPSSLPNTDFIQGSKAVDEEWRKHWLPRPLYLCEQLSAVELRAELIHYVQWAPQQQPNCERKYTP